MSTEGTQVIILEEIFHATTTCNPTNISSQSSLVQAIQQGAIQQLHTLCTNPVQVNKVCTQTRVNGTTTITVISMDSMPPTAGTQVKYAHTLWS